MKTRRCISSCSRVLQDTASTAPAERGRDVRHPETPGSPSDVSTASLPSERNIQRTFKWWTITRFSSSSGVQARCFVFGIIKYFCLLFITQPISEEFLELSKENDHIYTIYTKYNESIIARRNEKLPFTKQADGKVHKLVSKFHWFICSDGIRHYELLL